MRWLLAVSALLLFVAACGGDDGVAPGVPVLNESGQVVMPGGTVVYHVNPTATAYPTFTPVPATPTPLPSPTPTPYVFQPMKVGELRPPATAVPVSLAVSNEVEPVATATAIPVVTPVALAVNAPTEAPAPTAVLEEEAEPTPYPTPYGQLDSGGEAPVRFLYQSVFPLQGRNIPERFLTGEVSDLPAPAEFISTTAKYVGWVAAFDTLSVPYGWSFEGVVRWVNVSSLNRPFLMYESPVSMEKGTFVLTRVLGHDVDYVWYPGWYRVALLDSGFEEVIGWDFEVR